MPSQVSHSPRLVVALDFDSKEKCLNLVNELDPSQCRLKVGKELFTLYGPGIVEVIQNKGFDVFLDLKFHDIPATVGKAVKAAANLGVWMVNVHCSGGIKMMEAAREGLSGFQTKPLLIGVTVLTSMDEDDLAQIGISRSIDEHVLHLAGLAHTAGIDGLVCSARETALIRKEISSDLALVTPGIRPAGVEVQDQVRTMTPLEAINNGSSYIVVGRPITQAKDPRMACESIALEIK